MGVQVAGARLTRRIGRLVDADVLRAWTNGHPSHVSFVTVDHRHGEADRRSGEVRWADRRAYGCASSCRTLFGTAPCGCGHPNHQPFPCYRRSVGECSVAESACTDPAGHSLPCRCPADPEWVPPHVARVAAALGGLVAPPGR